MITVSNGPLIIPSDEGKRYIHSLYHKAQFRLALRHPHVRNTQLLHSFRMFSFFSWAWGGNILWVQGGLVPCYMITLTRVREEEMGLRILPTWNLWKV